MFNLDDNYAVCWDPSGQKSFDIDLRKRKCSCISGDKPSLNASFCVHVLAVFILKGCSARFSTCINFSSITQTAFYGRRKNGRSGRKHVFDSYRRLKNRKKCHGAISMRLKKSILEDMRSNPDCWIQDGETLDISDQDDLKDSDHFNNEDNDVCTFGSVETLSVEKDLTDEEREVFVPKEYCAGSHLLTKDECIDEVNDEIVCLNDMSFGYIPFKLLNSSNICHLNSLLQCICKCGILDPKILFFLKELPINSLEYSFQTLLKSFQQGVSDVKDASGFWKKVCDSTSQFIFGQQCDVCEVFLFLISKLKMNFFNRFKFKDLRMYSCLGCTKNTFKTKNEITRKSESDCFVLQVPLRITTEIIILEDLVFSELNCTQNVYDYNCEICGSNQVAKETYLFSDFGELLCVSVMRFSFDKETHLTKKIESNVSVYVGNEEKKMLDIGLGRKCEFIGMISHIGNSVQSGHYVAVVKKDSDSFYHCSDTVFSVMKRSSDFLVSQNSYCFFCKIKNPQIGMKRSKGSDFFDNNYCIKNEVIIVEDSPSEIEDIDVELDPKCFVNDKKQENESNEKIILVDDDDDDDENLFVTDEIVINDDLIAKVFEKSLSQTAPIVKRFNISLSRGVFIKNLSFGCCINDEIVSFYLAGLLLNFQKSGIFILSTFFLERLLRSKFSFENVKNWIKDVEFFRKYSKIIIPCHINGNHWCLFVISLEEKTFFCYDSLPNNVSFLRIAFSRWILCFYNHLRRIVKESEWKKFGLENESFGKDVSTWQYKHSPESFTQPNGFDCGPLMLLAMDYESRSCTTEHFGFKLPRNIYYNDFSLRLRNNIAKNLIIFGSSFNAKVQSTPLINSIILQ